MMGHTLPCLKSVTCSGVTAAPGNFFHTRTILFLHESKTRHDQRSGMSVDVESTVSIMLTKLHKQPS